MKRKRLIASISCGLVLAVALTSCSSGTQAVKEQNLKKVSTEVTAATKPSANPTVAKNRKDTLVVGSMDPSGQINPITNQTEYDLYLVNLTFNSLVNFDANGEPIPEVAKSWDVSKDGLTYTFHLRNDVKFDDGNTLTADDVAFTYTAACDPTYDGTLGSYVAALKGYNDYNQGNATSVSGIVVKNPTTISFTLNDKNASVLISLFNTGIMEKKYYAFDKGNFKKVHDLDLKPMGSGPYKLTSFKAGQETDLTRNPNYFKGAPKIKNIVCLNTNSTTALEKIEKGETDVDAVATNPTNVSSIKKAGFLDMQLFPSLSYNYIGLNLKNPLFTDKRVRQALTYGFNRKGYVDSFSKGYGQVSNEPFSPVQWAYTDNVNKYDYNPTKAGKLLDEAGWKLNKSDGYRYKDGKKFSFTLMYPEGKKNYTAIATIAKENYKKIGIDLNPVSLDFNTIITKTDLVNGKRDYDAFTMAWQLTPDPDATQIFDSSQDVAGGSNNVSFHNTESDKLLKQGLSELNQSKRKQIYAKWAKLINDECPYVFVSQGKELWAINSRVKGYKLGAFSDWSRNVEKLQLK
ncbi:MAG: ABC transporter substrate-binding protein [Clostridium sp.]|nr:ABC transporter substrate-binding protein [Clostridium sp.]